MGVCTGRRRPKRRLGTAGQDGEARLGGKTGYLQDRRGKCVRRHDPDRSYTINEYEKIILKLRGYL